MVKALLVHRSKRCVVVCVTAGVWPSVQSCGGRCRDRRHDGDRPGSPRWDLQDGKRERGDPRGPRLQKCKQRLRKLLFLLMKTEAIPVSSLLQRMLYDVHILPFFFKRQLTTFILPWNLIFFLISYPLSFWMRKKKKKMVQTFEISHRQSDGNYSHWGVHTGIKKTVLKNTALIVSVIDSKAAAVHKEICV